MILFTRTLMVLGNPRETGGWARRMAKLVTDKTGKETALWAGLVRSRGWHPHLLCLLPEYGGVRDRHRDTHGRRAVPRRSH